jgi:hypothetical protein
MLHRPLWACSLSYWKYVVSSLDLCEKDACTRAARVAAWPVRSSGRLWSFVNAGCSLQHKYMIIIDDVDVIRLIFVRQLHFAW